MVPDLTHPVIVRPHETEHVGLAHGSAFRLLADASTTGGTLGANVLALGEGADGAAPHHHRRSAELFYVLSGRAEFFLNGTLTPLEQGGLVVVPPGTPHAFGAAPGVRAELLVVLVPGVDRFDYFRALGRIAQGLDSFDSLLPLQERHDVHFLDPSAWRSARRG